MTRTEARKIAKQMVKSGNFPFVSIVEDVTHNEIRIEATNRCGMKRWVEHEADWSALKLHEVDQ